MSYEKMAGAITLARVLRRLARIGGSVTVADMTRAANWLDYFTGYDTTVANRITSRARSLITSLERDDAEADALNGEMDPQPSRDDAADTREAVRVAYESKTAQAVELAFARGYAAGLEAGRKG